MLKPNINQQNDSKTIVKQILKASENIFQVMGITIPPEWLMTDMTVAQLRVLLLLHTEGPSRMSSIAGTLGIAVSTATGIIDNLVKKELVSRSADAEDRRVVICGLSPKGQEVINGIWIYGQLQMKKLLNGLSPAQLEKAKEVAEMLLLNVKTQSTKSTGTINEIA
ncbi:MAG TPA: MarR family transcriptional regulator [Dehalococcoidales bacterium]|jgi:DNA-binding MarR family transcriptional regulator|nr:MarR family transcriptional regulator [Dehalococcoidales bacterium]